MASRILGDSVDLLESISYLPITNFARLTASTVNTVGPRGQRSPPAEHPKDLPSPDEVANAIELALQRLSHDRQTVEFITLCGNGEPTLYPKLAEVIATARRLRGRYFPKARLAILSNSSTIGNKTVREALEPLDLKIMKFDAGSEEMFRQLNHPRAPIYMGEIIAGLKELKNIFLQSLFVQGRVTNADSDSVGLWVEKVRDIRPLESRSTR